MKNAIGRVLAVISLLSLSVVAKPASAANGTITGTVTVLKSQDVSSGDSFFQLSSTQHVGQCIFDGATSQTLLLIPANDRGKQMFAIAQAALLSGKNVSVFVDDGGSSSQLYCFAKFVVISP